MKVGRACYIRTIFHLVQPTTTNTCLGSASMHERYPAHKAFGTCSSPARQTACEVSVQQVHVTHAGSWALKGIPGEVTAVSLLPAPLAQRSFPSTPPSAKAKQVLLKLINRPVQHSPRSWYELLPAACKVHQLCAQCSPGDRP